MDAQSIINEIESIVGNSLYTMWTIGVTDSPRRRREEHEDDHKSTFGWSVWDADTEEVARYVERHFIGEGMHGGAGGRGEADYVYIFQGG